MLSNLKIHPTLPASDLERAKKFYQEKLGFSADMETPAGVFYKAGDGTQFLVFPSSNAGSNPSTYAGFRTDDLEAEVAELKKKGVEFLEYDTPPLKTVNGIATTPVGKAAWFKDSEGNILGIVQMN